MKIEKTTTALVVIVLVVALATVGLVIYRLDLGMIYTLALILVGGVVLALIVGAAALPIRAYRTREGPHERERIIKHTIEREGRVPEAPKIYTVGQQQNSGLPGMFPELLRAAYLAGRRGLPGRDEPTLIEAETRDVVEEWNGDIRE